jgi:hypothetical protein
MNPQQAVTVFASYSDHEKLELLAHLSYELTLLAREAYVPGTDEISDHGRMREVNELQHQISGFLVKLLSNDPQRYPDDVFIQIIFEANLGNSLTRQFQDTFHRVTERMPVSP